MQGITVALSLEGIKELVEGMCAPASYLEKAINNTSLVDYSITDDSLGEAWINKDGSNAEDCSQIHVYLSQGAIGSFTISSSGPAIQQQANGTFLLSFSSGAAFNAKYTWNENWSQQDEYWEDSPDNGGQWVPQGSPYGQQAGPFDFSLGVESLDTTATFTFTYDSNSQTWQLPVSCVTTSPSNPTPNIPGGSVLQHSTSQGCDAQVHLEQGAVDSLDKGDDFHTALMNGVFNHPLESIPASGQLTPDIAFAFGLGDSPLAFPNNQGLTVGVTGISTYTAPGRSQPQQYPGTPPTNLPVPAVPTNGHHLQMYVSDYAINGLYWAFANDGQLTETVTPTMLQQMGADPSVLYVSTYYNSIPSSDPVKQALYTYRERVMYAKVSPALDSTNLPIPPTVNFQTVYVFDGPHGSVMTSLANDVAKNTFSSTDYNNLSNSVIPSNAYANAQDLVSDLNGISITRPQSIQCIETATQGLGAVVTHALELTCTIQGATLPNGDAPFFTFMLTRQDILTSLGLGVAKSGKAQTLQFTHVECQPSPSVNTPDEQAQFSNFIPLKSAMWFTSIWAAVGEQQYSTLLANLGQHGVPLPIMQGFQFVFEDASTNLEQGYIGILANVEFTS
jgi:hypothetical protein